jgi:signal transduction histidine kinase
VQEALTNVVKNAYASIVRVSLRVEDHEVVVERQGAASGRRGA